MKLSIITVNKNNAPGLKKTIESVVTQTFNNFEYIVIDGNSEDESVETIKKYADKITYWTAEPDTGIYNAMNKGIRKARGEYCLFLNSGDFLVDSNTLVNVFSEIEKNSDAGIYYSGCVNTGGQYFNPPQTVNIDYFLIHNLNHQNALIKRSLFEEHGFYNETFRIASDYEFWLRECWLYKTKFIYIKTSISIYDASGISSHSNFDRELEASVRNVLPELADPLAKLRRYSHSIYGTIVETYGYSKFFDFCLKSYRHLLKLSRKIFRPGYKIND